MPEKGKPNSPDIKQELIKIAEDRMKAAPYYRLLGLEVVGLSSGEARIGMRAGEHLHNTSGIVHGGAIASLADAASGVAVATKVKSGSRRIITIEQKVNFISQVREGYLTGIGRVVYEGGRIWVSESEIIDEGGRLVAKSVATHMVISR